MRLASIVRHLTGVVQCRASGALFRDRLDTPNNALAVRPAVEYAREFRKG